DICVKPLRQVVTATSDGALAATELEKYVAKVQERTGLKAQEPSIREKVPQKKETEEEQSGLLTAALKEQLETVFAKM
ncbi:MAG: thioredoxin reductase, partial [Lachnospiraceae bacterium]|nr:thioredoxin reductase [Lachnospiraceae bacterium]